MTLSHVYVPWLFHMCMCHDSFTCVCAMTLSHVYVPWLFHMYDATCQHVWHDAFIGIGWRRLIGSPKLQIILHKRAPKYRSLLRKMTYKDKGSYESSPPCISCPMVLFPTILFKEKMVSFQVVSVFSRGIDLLREALGSWNRRHWALEALNSAHELNASLFKSSFQEPIA